MRIWRGTTIQHVTKEMGQVAFLRVVLKAGASDGNVMFTMPRHFPTMAGVMAHKEAIIPVLVEDCTNASTTLLNGDIQTDLSCVTDGSDTVTSSALFGPELVGYKVTGTGVPAGTTVLEVVSDSEITVSEDIPAADPNLLTFAGPGAFYEELVGKEAVGTGITAGTFVDSVTDENTLTLSQAGPGGVLDVTFRTKLDRQWKSYVTEASETASLTCDIAPTEVSIVGASDGTTTITSDDGEFTPDMVGWYVAGTDVDAGTTIVQVYSGFSALVSAAVDANDPNTFTVTAPGRVLVATTAIPAECEGWAVTGTGVPATTYVEQAIDETSFRVTKDVDPGTGISITLTEPTRHKIVVEAMPYDVVALLIVLDEEAVGTS